MKAPLLFGALVSTALLAGFSAMVSAKPVTAPHLTLVEEAVRPVELHGVSRHAIPGPLPRPKPVPTPRPSPCPDHLDTDA